MKKSKKKEKEVFYRKLASLMGIDIKTDAQKESIEKFKKIEEQRNKQTTSRSSIWTVKK